MLYRFENVRKSYGPKEVLREVTWQHNPGEKVGLVRYCIVRLLRG